MTDMCYSFPMALLRVYLIHYSSCGILHVLVANWLVLCMSVLQIAVFADYLFSLTVTIFNTSSVMVQSAVS